MTSKSTHFCRHSCNQKPTMAPLSVGRLCKLHIQKDEKAQEPPRFPTLRFMCYLRTHTSSSSFTTFAWALLNAWSRISMCRLWSSLVERAVASSASSFSFSRWLSLSVRTWNINIVFLKLGQSLK